MRKPKAFVDLVCNYCHQAYRREPHRIADGEGKHCSMKCYHADKGNWTPEKFWANTTRRDNGCLEWNGKPMVWGYGRLRVKNKQIRAHRYAWQLVHGAEPPRDRMVCHSCDNRICVEPSHLFLGTSHDNMRDMAAKGRAAGSQRIGEKHPMAKLTAEQVREIRSRYINKRRYGNGPALAKEYGVTKTTLWAVATGRARTEVLL